MLRPVLFVFVTTAATLALPGCVQRGSVERAQEATPAVVEEYPDDVYPDSRGRLPIPDRASLDEDGRRSYDAVVYPGSRWEDGPATQVAMLMHSPFLAEHFAAVSSRVRFNSGRPQRLTELGILTAARELRSRYVWTSHEPLAREAGLEPGIIDLVKTRAAIGDGEGLQGFGDEERVIVAFVRQALSQEKVAADTFRQARALFGERGVAELVGLIGHYSVVNVTNKAFDMQQPVGTALLLPNLW